jgi:hypothetical protein
VGIYGGVVSKFGFGEKSKNIRVGIYQCQETAADFQVAYGLWRFMAFRFLAYGRISKLGQKPYFQLIRRNVAFRHKICLF